MQAKHPATESLARVARDLRGDGAKPVHGGRTPAPSTSSRPRVPCQTLWMALQGLGVLASVGGCSPDPASLSHESAEGEIVYGADDRREPWAFADATFASRAREFSVALFPRGSVNVEGPTNIELRGEPLGLVDSLCEGEPFAEQPVVAWCSGTLIAEDLVLTAGHCIEDRSQCLDTLFVFGFEMGEGGMLEPLTTEDVYDCQEVLARSYQEDGNDYAIVRLARPVVGRRPAPVRREMTALALGAPLILVGYPSGIPLKLAGGGQVLASHPNELNFFEANVDSFGGNSGSGVFLAETGELAGILAAGETDYVQVGECFVTNTCPEQGCGMNEESTYVLRAIEGYCQEGRSGPFCTCGDRLCGPDEDTASCAADCGSVCGDGACNGAESALDCLVDCGTCGNAECEEGEDTASCCADCGCEPGAECLLGACIVGPDAADTCAGAVDLELTEGRVVVTTDTRGAADDLAGTCGGTGAPDHAFTFALTDASPIEAVVQGFDTVLYLQSSCGVASSEIACSDDVAPEIFWSGLRADLQPGTYTVVVDGFYSGGVSTLALAASPPVHDECRGALPIVPSGTQVLREAMVLSSNDTVGSCGGEGPDHAYFFTLPEGTRATVTAESVGMDTVLYAKTACTGQAELDCNDDMGSYDQRGSRLVLEDLGPGTYYVIVDSYDEAQLGAYTLTVQFDLCPDDVTKDRPLSCGCGVPETDQDSDGAADCVDGCPDNPDLLAPTTSGCVSAEGAGGAGEAGAGGAGTTPPATGGGAATNGGQVAELGGSPPRGATAGAPPVGAADPGGAASNDDAGAGGVSVPTGGASPDKSTAGDTSRGEGDGGGGAPHAGNGGSSAGGTSPDELPSGSTGGGLAQDAGIPPSSLSVTGSAGAAGASAVAPAEGHDKRGCGCHAARTSSSSGLGVLGLLGIAALGRRRRRA